MDKPGPIRRRELRGLPAGALSDRRLSFDARSSTLILSGIERRPNAFPQLYVRKVTETRYTNVAELVGKQKGPGPAAEFAVTTWTLGDASKIFCAVSEGEASEEKIRPLRHNSLAVLHLDDWRCETWEERHGRLDGIVVADLVGSIGDLVHGIIGFRSTNFRGPVEYHLASLDWTSGVIAKIEPMTDIFF